jgi:hypothetical protein
MEEKYFELELPSRLIPYKADGVSKVEVRMLKGKDEKLIGEFTIANFEKKFKMLLDNVIRGIAPEKLTIGDRFYIVVWLAMNCQSHLYPIELTCDECYRKTERYDIDLGTMQKVLLPETFAEPYAIKLMDGSELKLRLYRVQDQITYIDYVQAKGADDLLFKAAQSMVDDKDMGQRIAYLENLPIKDMALIRAFHDKFYHGVKLEAAYKCPKCEATGITPVPFRLDILFPDGATVTRSIGRGV